MRKNQMYKPNRIWLEPKKMTIRAFQETNKRRKRKPGRKTRRKSCGIFQGEGNPDLPCPVREELDPCGREYGK